MTEWVDAPQASAPDARRVAIGVSPPVEFERRLPLLRSLEQALPVSFEPLDAHRVADAVVAFGNSEDGASPAPGGRRLVFLGGGRGRTAHGPSRLADARELDRRLRGRVLYEGHARLCGQLTPRRGDSVLASWDGSPVWLRRPVGGSTVDLVAAGCEGLGEGRVLRDLLRPGRFLGLLPLLHFLREVSGKLAWSAPPPRALVIFDDPNLHWTSYGYLKLRELARSARTHGYHVAFATIPLDGFFAHPAAVRILRERSGEMSLVVHGAEHEGAELLRSRPGDQTRSLLAQALRRIESFEGRTGLRVERVMVPPHGVCSHETLRAMLALDFEAVCTFWPFPEPPGTPPPGWPLAGWEPAQLLGGGLPVLSRYPFAGHPLDDLVFRAFLDQPLILFGHHDDLAGGFDRLLEAVEFVQGLGAVTWMSAGGIARTNLFTRREERTLRVRLFTRRASVEVPAGVDSVIVELPPAHGPEGRQHLLTSAGRTGLVTSNTRPARVMLSVGAGRLDLRLASETALDPGRLEAPPRRIRPLVRRLATETRDRLDPALRRVLR